MTMMMMLRLGLLLMLWSFWSSESEATAAPHVSCKDENDRYVDWYILYKAPGGQRYIYVSDDGAETSNRRIGDSSGVLANTLRPMFDNNMASTFGFISYNDQPPKRRHAETLTETEMLDSDESDSDDSDSETLDYEQDFDLRPAQFGHSKGVVLGDSQTKTALWLTHSTPKFPKNRNPNSFWPTTGEKNGQTFMCVTVNFDQLKVIGTHLQNIHAYTFDRRIPASFPQEMKNASDNIGGPPQSDPLVQSLMVGTGKWKRFAAVAKVTNQTAADGDLYVQLSRIFQSDLDAKTWGCQVGRDKSYCERNQHKVMTLLEVKTDLGEWKWSKDHSKWAVTTTANKHWTCIADMNRARSQYKRPGGALCIEDKKVSHLFRGFVKVRLLCGQNPKRPLDCATTADVESLADDLQEMDLEHEEL